MSKHAIVQFFFRLSIASVFLYAAIGSFINSDAWLGFFPRFMREILPPNLLLNIFSVYEIVLALWVLWGKYLFYSSALAALTLAGIIIFNISLLDIVFRDLAILFISIGLMLDNYKKSNI
jgi:hypothetical protein